MSIITTIENEELHISGVATPGPYGLSYSEAGKAILMPWHQVKKLED